MALSNGVRKALYAFAVIFVILLVVMEVYMVRVSEKEREWQFKHLKSQLESLSNVIEAYHEKTGKWPQAIDSNTLQIVNDELHVYTQRYRDDFTNIGSGKPIRLVVESRKITLIGQYPAFNRELEDIIWVIRDEKGNKVDNHFESNE